MNAAISNSLTEIYRKTIAVLGLLQERDCDLHPDDHKRHTQEIAALDEIVQHLRVVEREFWP